MLSTPPEKLRLALLLLGIVLGLLRRLDVASGPA